MVWRAAGSLGVEEAVGDAGDDRMGDGVGDVEMDDG
jgi:hypothetical protein